MEISTKIKGHVLIQDKATGEVLLDKMNAVHPQNMAKIIARGLANEPNQQIFKIALGNGGTFIGSDAKIVYNPTVTQGLNAKLYNKTYEEVVDDSFATAANLYKGNSVISQASPDSNDTSSLVICTIQLSAKEPVDQAATDSQTTNTESAYTFDELGLMTADSPGLLLSHIIFNPIEKNQQRELIISYTLTISVS